MTGFLSVFKREVKSYFTTPVAYVFLTLFLLVIAVRVNQVGFLRSMEASLRPLFGELPILLLFFVPAIGMRLWAEERRSQTIEMLFTLPITTCQAVMGKYCAALLVLLLALALTFPYPWAIYSLGEPDTGPIVAGYLGAAALMAVYLAISSFFSSLTRNQVIAFVLAGVTCAVFHFAASPTVLAIAELDWGFLQTDLPARILEQLSTLNRFESLQRGVIEIRDILFFAILIGGWLWANSVLLEERKAA